MYLNKYKKLVVKSNYFKSIENSFYYILFFLNYIVVKY